MNAIAASDSKKYAIKVRWFYTHVFYNCNFEYLPRRVFNAFNRYAGSVTCMPKDNHGLDMAFELKPAFCDQNLSIITGCDIEGDDRRAKFHQGFSAKYEIEASSEDSALAAIKQSLSEAQHLHGIRHYRFWSDSDIEIVDVHEVQGKK